MELDLLARSLKHLLALVSDFTTNGIGFLSLQDQINTTTAQGRLIFNMFASLSDLSGKSSGNGNWRVWRLPEAGAGSAAERKG